MMAVTCPECGKRAHLEQYERGTSLDGPREIVRLVRCDTVWKHARVLQPGQADPPPFAPPVRTVPKPPAVKPSRLTAEDRERELMLLGVLRSMRPKDADASAAPDCGGLPIAPRPQHHEEVPMPAPISKYPTETRMRAVQLVLEGKTHTQAAAEAGVPVSAVGYWMSEHKRWQNGNAAPPLATKNTASTPADRHSSHVPSAPATARTEPTVHDASSDDSVAQALSNAAAARTSPTGRPTRVDSSSWDEYNHALDRLGSISIERLARIEDPGEAASILRLVFRGQHERLAKLGEALVGGAA